MTSDLVKELRDLSPGPSWEMTRIGNEVAARIEYRCLSR